jgi:hypothetical protein
VRRVRYGLRLDSLVQWPSEVITVEKLIAEYDHVLLHSAAESPGAAAALTRR